MENGKGTEERRRHPRFLTKIHRVRFSVLKVSPSGGPYEFQVAKAIDVARGGMRFRAEQEVEAGARIQYFVDSFGGQPGREGTARVIRVEREGKEFIVAVEFIT